ncbi:MAG: ParB N-terminal domain-containing protein [Syntrophales bacterium]|nr:ParB N-terminal domain-containing protein [Syntrophales bacterium]MDD5640161.1 ParB N-terminal domain-containing protein [Syntrophales bacterium]
MPKVSTAKPTGPAESKVEFIPIQNLKFDPYNPRLPSSINGQNQSAVLEWMLRDASILELMLSIGEKGYFPGEPLLVVPDKASKGIYKVVEGNRRLCAVKLLHNPDIAPVRRKSVRAVSESAPNKPDTLPALIYNDRSEILSYLGYRHVTGIKQWDPLAKAKYLKQLQKTVEGEEPATQYKTLAKTIGSRADYVAALLTSLSVYDQIQEDDFFGIKSLNEESIDFSLLTTALSYNNIVNFLGLSSRTDPTLTGLKKDHLKELTQWIFEKVGEGRTRLGESRNLSRLNSVVSNEKALSSFRAGKPLKEAELLTERPGEIFSIAIVESKARLEVAREHQHLVEKPAPIDVDNLGEILTMARDIRTVIKSRLQDLES